MTRSKLLYLFFATGTLIMIFVMICTGKKLKTATTPLGIINLETAANAVSVKNILYAWDKTGDSTDTISAARKNTWLDFIFIIFYAPFLYFSCIKLSHSFKKKSILAKTGKPVGKVIIIGGTLDFFENFGMLRSLDGSVSDNVAFFTASCSIVKWLLLFIGIIYLLVGLVAKLLLKKRTSTTS